MSSGETDFLIRYPEEISYAFEEEKELLERANASGNQAMLVCLVEDKIAGIPNIYVLLLAVKGIVRPFYSIRDYLEGSYTWEVPAPFPKPDGDKPPFGKPDEAKPPFGKPEAMPSLGDLLLRPPKGVPYVEMKPPVIQKQGSAKPWLKWDGEKAQISDLDTYVLEHRRRMKPCTSFDKLEMDSGENQVFGDEERDYVHFNPQIGTAITNLAGQYPKEAGQYGQAFSSCMNDALADRIALLNPMTFIGKSETCKQAGFYRIRTGASDADTSLSVSMILALRLANEAVGDVDYKLVWDQPHSEADYPGEILAWIDRICR